MSKPRIYVAISTFHPIVGGAERQAFVLAKSLRKLGYDVLVMTLRQQKNWSRQEMVEGVPVVRVGGSVMGGRERYPGLIQKSCYILGLCAMGWALWRHRNSYDILHVYHLNLFALPAALVSLLAHKPLIVGIRSAGVDADKISMEPLSLLAGTLDPSSPWLQVPGRLMLGGDLNDLERLGWPVVRGMQFLLHRCQAVVIVLSSRMKSYLSAHNFPVEHTQLIPNGVDIQRFAPIDADFSVAEREQVVVCVSRLCYRKGTDVLLHAWHQVHQICPQARLILVGDGPIREQLMYMARELGISECVEFAGIQRNIPLQLHRGSIAVLPSRIEGMPNAVLEAMACGLACVATRISGSEDIIQHGINGLLVEPEDYQGLAAALQTLLLDPELARQFGKAARTHIERHYSIERVTAMYTDLYEHIMKQKRLPGQRLASASTPTSRLKQVGRKLRNVWHSRVC